MACMLVAAVLVMPCKKWKKLRETKRSGLFFSGSHIWEQSLDIVNATADNRWLVAVEYTTIRRRCRVAQWE